MLIQINLNGTPISFTITPLIKIENDKLSFYIQEANGRSMLLEQRGPYGKWIHIRGDTFDGNVLRALCEIIDSTSSALIINEVMLFDDFKF